jgi:hypothetical protein
MAISLAPFAAPDIAPVLPTLRAFSVRRIGYVLSILFALLSRDALAQAIQRVVVTLEPGEFRRSIAVVPGVLIQFEVTTPGVLCNWPSLNVLRSRIPLMNESSLNALEGHGTATSDAIARGLNVLLGDGPERVHNIQVIRYMQAGIPRERLVPGLDITEGRNCLELEQARSALLQIRQVIRAYLGLPLVPTEPARVERLERPATLQAPTGVGSPATVR